MFGGKKNKGVYDQPGPEGKKNRVKAGKSVGIIVMFFLALYLFAGSVYTLKENEYAVVTTFGMPDVVEESGIHFKIPYIQELKKVPKTINGFPIGYETNSEDFLDKESFMITRDYNFVNVDFYVAYRVTDPIKYLYSSEDPIAILKNLTQSYIRDTIGLYDVDSVITTGKNEIQASIKDKIVVRLEQEDIGIQLVNITIQDAEPPTQEVINAFKNVENAKQGKETSINRANQKRNEDIPAARAAFTKPAARIPPHLPGPAVWKGFCPPVFSAPSLTLSIFTYTEFYTVPKGADSYESTTSSVEFQMLLPRNFSPSKRRVVNPGNA